MNGYKIMGDIASSILVIADQFLGLDKNDLERTFMCFALITTHEVLKGLMRSQLIVTNYL